MTRRKFLFGSIEEPFHDTELMYIGVTQDAEAAGLMEAGDTSLIRIPEYRWPWSVRTMPRAINFVIKEVGEENFLVVVNK